MRRKDFSLIICCCLLIGCSYQRSFSEASAKPKADFVTLEKGILSCFPEKKDFLITTTDQWEKLWKQKECYRFKVENDQVIPDPVPAPSIDFESKSVIAVFYGPKSTGGYTIEIKNVIRGNQKTEIQIEEASPGNRCGVTAASTYPYHIVTIEKTAQEIIFIHTQRVRECD